MGSKVKFTKRIRDILPVLKKHGYVYLRCKGSHFTFVNETNGKHITINKDLNAMVKLRLLKEMGDEQSEID